MKRLTDLSEQDRLHLFSSSIAICGLARNCARSLPENIKFVERLRGLFADSEVVVVENDSTDTTRMLLDQWANHSNGVVILDGDSSGIPNVPPNKKVNQYYSRHRINKLAHYRNQYLQFINNPAKQFDYVLVLDWDVRKISFDGVLDSFSKRDIWDVICAYGYSISPRLRERFHDTYSLILLGEENIPQTEKSIKKLQSRFRNDKINQKLIPVSSAFGGLTIYKAALLKNINYEVIDNGDCQVEVKCEHVSIYEQMRKKNTINALVNPKMHLLYQTLFDALLRKLSTKGMFLLWLVVK